ncbi:MAG TPA: ribonuclease P protein component [Xanthomonadales bacterium]|nr:ribonuclease P protein component [Xanthomonadales bacterium]
MKFPRQARINSKADFRRVFARPAVSRDRYFKVLSCANGLEYARLGMAVSRQNCRKATGRNRIKRLVRESFRLNQDLLASPGGLDMVVLPSALAATMCNKTLLDSLQDHWRKTSDCARQRSEENRIIQ